LIRELDNRLVAISNKIGIIPQESKFILDLESIFTQGDELYELELESYSFFKNLVDHKLKEFWLTISNFHIESLSFNYYNWKYLKDNPGKFNSIAKLNDPNVYFNQIRKLNYIDNLHIEIPQSINLLTNLKKLNIRHNYIKKLPESLFHMKSLQVLDFNHNQIKRIPESIIKLKNIESLIINDNYINSFSNSIKNYLSSLKDCKF
ncbi:MAG: leucine-rich repeat domain-containing protein, partial [Candidatus Thorarchaeota archaeon]